MSIWSFTLPIEPVPKGRPRLGRHGVHTPPETVRFEREVALLAKRHAPRVPLDGPIYVDLTFVLRKPKQTKNTEPCVRPDVDNFSKGVLDALNQVFWKDDGQIVKLNARKIYAQGKPPQIEVVIMRPESLQACEVQPGSKSERLTSDGPREAPEDSL